MKDGTLFTVAELIIMRNALLIRRDGLASVLVSLAKVCQEFPRSFEETRSKLIDLQFKVSEKIRDINSIITHIDKKIDESNKVTSVEIIVAFDAVMSEIEGEKIFKGEWDGS